VRNHAKAIVACDFCVVVTATFKTLYVFVVMEHASRRILHINVTKHPTVHWTMQQLREAIPADHGYRFLIHDRDCIFSQQLNQQARHLGLRILKTPARSPQANALCERLLGTLRRECVDFVIPLTETHVQGISLNLSEFVGGRNGQSTSQILPSWLYWQWLDLTPPARSAPPARRHSVDERSAGIERTRGTLAGCICRCHETPEGICVHLSCCLYMTMTSFLAVGLFPCNGLAFPAA
jgi:transposase InsO family protein